jgi:hypothetical protein
MTRFYFMIFALMIILFVSQLQASYQTPFLMEEEGLYSNDSVALTQNIPQKDTKRKLMEEKVVASSLPPHKPCNVEDNLEESYSKIDEMNQNKDKTRELSSEQEETSQRFPRHMDICIFPLSQDQDDSINNLPFLWQISDEPERQGQSFQTIPLHGDAVVLQEANINNKERNPSPVCMLQESQLQEETTGTIQYSSPYEPAACDISPHTLQFPLNTEKTDSLEFPYRGAAIYSPDIFPSSKPIFLSSPSDQELPPFFQLMQEIYPESIALDSDKEIVYTSLFGLKIAEIEKIYRDLNIYMPQQRNVLIEANKINLEDSNNFCNKSP